jgi:DNA-binding transcriptional ArsR family regulator
MKSQDIFLLLKLCSISRQGRDLPNPSLAQEGWQDWMASEVDDSSANLENSLNEEALSDMYSVRALAGQTGISKSEVSNALNRCYQSGLAKPSRVDGTPSVNTKALQEFIVYGIRYVFPVAPQGLTRGITTGLTAPVFKGELISGGDMPPVWPDPNGATSGLSVTPLFKTVTYAIRKDPGVYALLALVDSIRLGLPRERNLAISKLEQLLRA